MKMARDFLIDVASATFRYHCEGVDPGGLIDYRSRAFQCDAPMFSVMSAIAPKQPGAGRLGEERSEFIAAETSGRGRVRNHPVAETYSLQAHVCLGSANRRSPYRRKPQFIKNGQVLA